MKARTLLVVILVLATASVACQKKREPRAGHPSAGQQGKAGASWKPNAANLHDESACPAGVEGTWIINGGDSVTVGRNGQNQLVISGPQSPAPSVIDGRVHFESGYSYVGYCNGKKLTFVNRDLDASNKGTREVELIISTETAVSGKAETITSVFNEKEEVTGETRESFVLHRASAAGR